MIRSVQIMIYCHQIASGVCRRDYMAPSLSLGKLMMWKGPRAGEAVEDEECHFSTALPSWHLENSQ